MTPSQTAKKPGAEMFKEAMNGLDDRLSRIHTPHRETIEAEVDRCLGDLRMKLIDYSITKVEDRSRPPASEPS